MALPTGGFALSGTGGVSMASTDLEISSSFQIGEVEAMAVCAGELMAVTADGALRRCGAGREFETEAAEAAAAEEVREPKISKVVKSVDRFPRVSPSSISSIVASVVDPIIPSHLSPNPRQIFAALARRLVVA